MLYWGIQTIVRIFHRALDDSICVKAHTRVFQAIIKLSDAPSPEDDVSMLMKTFSCQPPALFTTNTSKEIYTWCFMKPHLILLKAVDTIGNYSK